MTAPARPRLLVISQVYVPDPAAVGQYMADATEEMARQGWDVTVYTSARGYDDPAARYPMRERKRGVEVRRFPFSSFGKRSIAIRLAAQSLFVTQAILRALCAKRFDLILVSTSPPFAGFCGTVISSITRTPFVWWGMDLNPDQMVAAGKLSSRSIAARVFEWMNRGAISRAKAIVVLDRFMKDRVVAKLPGDLTVASKVSVIPPWSLDAHLAGAPNGMALFRQRNGLEGKFVVMYAGNHSDQNPLGTLLDAADRVRDLERLVFVFVGGGAGKGEIERRIASGAGNMVSLPYQPIEVLAATLGAADVHVVSVGDSMVGIVHPCKIYSAMAVGRPILLLGPNPCHAAEIIGPDRLGWHVAHGDVAGAEGVLREMHGLPNEYVKDLGHRAAALTESQYSRSRLLAQFVQIMLQSAST
jgi:colanic acid biosynthesis glycosyl transferase WcaI